ncbi:hypothetical protein BWI97_17515 [Siphonobacter sp. BAB-5405]|uniref:hypothetical protein n=1 Tax=Siphonobacter sp. BAB-5405 TaxID=1864825 RepID=UPI000C80F3FF|nr:hypothetical protein [Siphonobacter sp. BAB-5405]PMD93741.1 hypothetical protein BWI97_17515 [Siphonobacter sp. BAB-5405]
MKIGIEILDIKGNFVKTHYIIIDQTWDLRRVHEGVIYYHPISGIGNDQIRLLSSSNSVGKHNHLKPYLKIEKYDPIENKGNISMDYLGNRVTQEGAERYFLTHFNITSISHELP